VVLNDLRHATSLEVTMENDNVHRIGPAIEIF
jgi:hypothetical protein